MRRPLAYWIFRQLSYDEILGADGGGVIIAHETAVSGDIGAEDGGKFAFEVLVSSNKFPTNEVNLLGSVL